MTTEDPFIKGPSVVKDHQKKFDLEWSLSVGQTSRRQHFRKNLTFFFAVLFLVGTNCRLIYLHYFFCFVIDDKNKIIFSNQRLCESLSDDEQFTPTKLIRDLHEQGLALGLVIDLTNTKRYYTPQV